MSLRRTRTPNVVQTRPHRLWTNERNITFCDLFCVCCIFRLNFLLLVTFLLNPDDTRSRLYETHLGADCGQIEAMITQNWQLDFNTRMNLRSRKAMYKVAVT